MRNGGETAASQSRPQVVPWAVMALATASLVLLGGAAAQASGGADAATAQQTDATGRQGETAGQASDAAGAAPELFGASQWVVERLVLDGEERPLGPDVPSGLVLTHDPLALAGTVGCNQMTAAFQLSEVGAIEFGPMIATLMACPEPAMTQEHQVTRALEGVTHYRRQPGRIVLSGPGTELVLVSASVGGTPPGAGARLGYAAFNRAVERAAAAGAAWPGDPLRVALAFVTLSGAPETTVARNDAGPENADLTVVTVLERGLLDDALAGVTQHVTLRRDGDAWLVMGHETVWLCARGPDRELTEPKRCP